MEEFVCTARPGRARNSGQLRDLVQTVLTPRFQLRGMNVMWKRTNNNGGSAWGDNYKLIDDVGRIIAIYQDVVLSLKKDGRIQIKEDLDPETVDLIVLTAVSLAHKKKQDN